MTYSFKHMLLLFSLLSLALLIPAVATAEIEQHDVEVRNTTVVFSDLNLAREEDVLMLYQRLQKAAKKVCGHGTDSGILPLQMKWQYYKCVFDALNGAVYRVNNKSLTSLHNQ